MTDWIRALAASFSKRLVREVHVMDTMETLIRRKCDIADELAVIVIQCDEIIHTDEHPFCSDGNCPCHGGQTWEQIDYQTEYLEQPFNDGLLTVPEYHRLFWNEQL